MKKLMNVALLFLLCCGAVSCDLNKYPSNALPEAEGFKTYSDATEFRRGFYAYVRSCFGSSSIIPTNIQAEGINPSLNFGNQLSRQYNWDFSDNDDYVSGLWTNYYGTIFQINYFLQKANEIIEHDSNLDEYDENKMTPAQLEDMNLFMAEARFFRAMLNRQIALLYCEDYDPETASENLGIIISEHADVTARLSRTTLAETYEAINDDINYAEPIIENYYQTNTSNPNYISPYTVKCLKAKVLLDTHNYEECAALCEEIVRAYPLITNANAFQSMWTNDQGTEIVFQFYASATEGATSLGGMFLNDPYNTQQNYEPYYLPSQWMLDMYDDADVRKSVYFGLKGTHLGTSNYNLYLVTKYPGNPAYNTNSAQNALLNNVRPYRSADFQLMAAECYAQNNQLDKANSALETLLKARIILGSDTYTYEPYASTDEIMAAIRNERLKELFMEGNRIADLKRWKMPMSRLAQNPQNSETIIPTSIYLEIPANDYRFVWPIPLSETSQNSNIKNQQNRGW